MSEVFDLDFTVFRSGIHFPIHIGTDRLGANDGGSLGVLTSAASILAVIKTIVA